MSRSSGKFTATKRVKPNVVPEFTKQANQPSFDSWIDEQKLGRLMRLSPTLQDACYILNVSQDRLLEHIKLKYNLTWEQYKQKKLLYIRQKLVTQALKRAKKSDIMLIFCLKNICGWGDKSDANFKETDKDKLDKLPGFTFVTVMQSSKEKKEDDGNNKLPADTASS